jgi:hypothetical protein
MAVEGLAADAEFRRRGQRRVQRPFSNSGEPAPMGLPGGPPWVEPTASPATRRTAGIGAYETPGAEGDGWSARQPSLTLPLSQTGTGAGRAIGHVSKQKLAPDNALLSGFER